MEHSFGLSQGLQNKPGLLNLYFCETLILMPGSDIMNTAFITLGPHALVLKGSASAE